MKLPLDPRIPRDGQNLPQRLSDALRDVAAQVNGLAEGRLKATYNAQTAAPTTGKHARGDFVKNSEPSELGTAASKYVIVGWVCVTAGEPGTWAQCRFLTGN